MEDCKFKSAGEFIRTYEEKYPKSHFFSPDTLKFFGERRSEMRLLKATEKVKDISGHMHNAYVLSSMQRLTGRRKYHYFDTETLKEIITE